MWPCPCGCHSKGINSGGFIPVGNPLASRLAHTHTHTHSQTHTHIQIHQPRKREITPHHFHGFIPIHLFLACLLCSLTFLIPAESLLLTWEVLYMYLSTRTYITHPGPEMNSLIQMLQGQMFVSVVPVAVSLFFSLYLWRRNGYKKCTRSQWVIVLVLVSCLGYLSTLLSGALICISLFMTVSCCCFSLVIRAHCHCFPSVAYCNFSLFYSLSQIGRASCRERV